jgi:hypothetical protein
MSKLSLTEKTDSNATIYIELADKNMAVNLNKTGDYTEVILSSSASQLVFCYLSSLPFDDLIDLPVQNIYQTVYNNFTSFISKDAEYYEDGTRVAYNVSQAFRSYRRNLPQIELASF